VVPVSLSGVTWDKTERKTARSSLAIDMASV
jgi:hypothetical protein